MRGLYPVFDDSVSRILHDIKCGCLPIELAHKLTFSKINIVTDLTSRKRFLSLLVSQIDDKTTWVNNYCVMHTLDTNGSFKVMDANRYQNATRNILDRATRESEIRLINYGVNSNYTDCINCAPYDIAYVQKQEKLAKRENAWLRELNNKYQNILKELN